MNPSRHIPPPGSLGTMPVSIGTLHTDIEGEEHHMAASSRTRSREERVPTARISTLTLIPWASATRAQLSPAAGSRIKRLIDVTGAGALLVIAAPVWLVVAGLIKASSPGPVLFRQQRVGLNGRPFTMLKFRSMRNGVSVDPHRSFVRTMVRPPADGGATNGNGTVYKLASDSRTTAVGRWLRRTSLDEVPQLINVLRGEMSLVGPRPPLPYEVEDYEPWQHERLTVRPGMTGAWQVADRYRLPYYEMCRIDVDYIHTWSVGRDLSILARTPGAMISRDGTAR
jgi:lipopolysaccharide/colanic/teichoic acid biosynthesis glycosyltransferase